MSQENYVVQSHPVRVTVRTRAVKPALHHQRMDRNQYAVRRIAEAQCRPVLLFWVSSGRCRELLRGPSALPASPVTDSGDFEGIRAVMSVPQPQLLLGKGPLPAC